MNEAMSREQVERTIDEYELQLSKLCGSDGVAASDLLKHDAALRATIQQQAEQIERLTEERDAALTEVANRAHFETSLRNTRDELQRQLAEREAMIAELRQRLDMMQANMEANGKEYRRVLGGKLAAEQREQRLREALHELHAIVRGECPSLLNEDSGGDARLSIAIEEALAETAPQAEPSPSPQGGDAPNRER